ncbi:hypothetical protein DWY67_04890 [Ruminococcus sp. AF26-25AA]|nr:hypothetical protein DWY67_04890 [Ruminococcus sp. AF26-25AA]
MHKYKVEVSTERSDFAVAGLARIFVGAGALDSPFLGAARFEFIQTMWATKGRSYKKIIAARRYHNSSLLTPHPSFLISYSSLDKRKKFTKN